MNNERVDILEKLYIQRTLLSLLVALKLFLTSSFALYFFSEDPIFGWSIKRLIIISITL